MQQVTRKKLGEGVSLTCVTTTKFKRAVLRAALLLPLGGPDAAGRAALPQVLRRGTARLPDLRAIGAALDEQYGARIEAMVRKEGETLAIGFLADCIDEAYAPEAGGLTASVIRLLCEMLYEPCLSGGVFRADYTEGERDNLLDRIAAQKNDPRAWAPHRLMELMCADEAYGQPALGTAEQARRITENKLYTAYERALDEAQLELFYCGAMQPDEAAALFLSALPERKAEKPRYMPHTEVRAAPKDAAREVIEEEPVKQGKLSLGFRTGGNCLTGGNPAAYWLFQTAFGGSTNSRLFLHVREKQSLCYYASAQFIASKGIMMVNSGIENRDFERARDEILHQLE
ncbi:MAG: M16 family metallopeptidase, partial [Agathobaculum sp.]|uniref:M16 family metallopeptidase n=1 Tax=Agathobaculum sp. TaxID=2048138 RepID=UPI003D940848